MTEIKLFTTPYKRPKKLSNPFDEHCRKDLEKIINTDDQSLSWWEFRTIFHFSTPAGTYKECCYFLPYAIRYLSINPQDDGLECLSPIICFISENADDLKRDKLWETCIRQFKNCLDLWTNEFWVTHYDMQMCQDKGWNLEYNDIVKNSQRIIETLDALVDCKALKSLAFDFIEEIRCSKFPIKSAWYLELSNSIKGRKFVETDPRFKDMISNKDYLKSCADVVKNSLLLKFYPTYWQDVFNTLML